MYPYPRPDGRPQTVRGVRRDIQPRNPPRPDLQPQVEENNALLSLTLPSISEDDENNDSDGTAPLSPPSPSNAPKAHTRFNLGDDVWDSKGKSHEHSHTPRRSALKPASWRYEKLRPAATHPNLGRSWEVFEIRDELEITRVSMERLDTQMASLTRDVAALSQEVRTTLTLLQQMCTQGTAHVLPQTTQSCEFLQNMEGHQSLPRRSSSQPLAMSAVEVGMTKQRGTKITCATQTDLFLLSDLVNKTVDAGSPPPNSGYSSCSSNEDKVRFVIGQMSNQRDDSEMSVSDDSVLRTSLSMATPPKDSELTYRIQRPWSSQDCPPDTVTVPKRVQIVGSSRDLIAHDEHLVEIKESPVMKRKLSTEL